MPPEVATRVLPSPLGPLHAQASDVGITRLGFSERTHRGDRGDSPHMGQLAAELDAYFRGTRRAFTVPLDLRGPPFHRRVWEQLLLIPCGQTRSYAQIARILGVPGGSRAVGQANGANPVAIVVPCHRVIASDGSLGGYGGGLERKRRLLSHEGAGGGHGLRAIAAYPGVFTVIP